MDIVVAVVCHMHFCSLSPESFIGSFEDIDATFKLHKIKSLCVVHELNTFSVVL